MSLSQQITEAEVSKIVGRPEIDYYTVDAAGAITHYRWDGAKMAPMLSASAVAAVGALVSLGTPSVVYHPAIASALTPLMQFRAATDTTAALGAVGVIINAANNTEASNRLAAGGADIISTVNGTSLTGIVHYAGPFDTPITTVHIGVLGLTPPYSVAAASPVLAASQQMARLTFDAIQAVKALIITEGPPTNFSGAAGTGSARSITVVGLAS